VAVGGGAEKWAEPAVGVGGRFTEANSLDAEWEGAAWACADQVWEAVA